MGKFCNIFMNASLWQKKFAARFKQAAKNESILTNQLPRMLSILGLSNPITTSPLSKTDTGIPV